MRAPTDTEMAENMTNARTSPPLPLDIVEDAPDVLDDEAPFAEPEAFDDPAAEAVDEAGAEAGVAADSFSTPAVSTTGTIPNSLRVVVVSIDVLVEVISWTLISMLKVTWQTAEAVPLISQLSETEASTPMVSVANWYSRCDGPTVRVAARDKVPQTAVSVHTSS